MYGAFIIGAIGALNYLAAAWLLAHTRIDDPVNSVTVHLMPGMWGLTAVGMFAVPVRCFGLLCL